jgi:hypothetical protein
MDIEYTSKIIKFEKELNSLDKFAIDFASILNKLEIGYVLVSGYVSILFGRSRSSEDIDLIVSKMDFNQFQKLWSELYKHFECLNTENAKEAYTEYLLNNHAIRFSRKNRFIPNIEFKFPKIELNQLDLLTLKERKKVILNDHTMFISPIELQIAFKFFLGSEKDIGDALHLYEIFKNKINIELMHSFSRKLKIEELLNQHIK